MTSQTTGPDRWIVAIQGELDMSTRADMASLSDILSGLGMDVDLDMSGVRFIDSSGWDAVSELTARLQRAGIATRIVDPSEPVRRVRALLDRPWLQPAAA